MIGHAITGTSVHDAQAQEMIETSADSHDMRFFGEGVLQIVVTDPDSDGNSVVETTAVRIDAEPDSGSGGSASIVVPETAEGSGKFEFFLAHEDANAVDPADLDAMNSAGVEGDGMCISDCAPVVTFGTGGDLSVDADLYEETAFEITASGAEVKVYYEETSGTVALDRTAYGSDSFIYIRLSDQDANLNPSARDGFIFDPDSAPNGDLLALNGGTFEALAPFKETGDNTAVFEARFELGVSIEVASESAVLTLFEKANYGETLDAPENDSNETHEIGFLVGNRDGVIEVGGQPAATWDPTLAADKDRYMPGETVLLTIEDPDANVDPQTTDYIHLAIDSETEKTEISALETGVNTGTFKTSISLGVLAANETVTIHYTDKRPADYSEKVAIGENPEKDFILEIRVDLEKIGIEATRVTAPGARDIRGDSGPFVPATQLALSTTVSNSNYYQQWVVALFEVRDDSGITVYLAWQAVELGPGGSYDATVPWQPEKAGIYQLRVFTISGIPPGVDVFSPPQVLSPVATSQLAIA